MAKGVYGPWANADRRRPGRHPDFRLCGQRRRFARRHPIRLMESENIRKFFLFATVPSESVH